jgi:hypothetical protein
MNRCDAVLSVVTFSTLILTVASLVATGVALLWANQSRNQPMFFVVAVVLFVAAEFVMGWWALPVVGLVLGIIGARRSGVVLMVAGAAVLAWGILFVWTASQGSLGTFMVALAAAMKQKPNVLLALVAAIPVLLAAPAARLGAALRPEASATPPVRA